MQKTRILLFQILLLIKVDSLGLIELSLSNQIIKVFDEIILHYWGSDVEKFCVGGKKKI